MLRTRSILSLLESLRAETQAASLEGIRDAFTLALDDEPGLEVMALPEGQQAIDAAATARATRAGGRRHG
jgi:hypothetical protein